MRHSTQTYVLFLLLTFLVGFGRPSWVQAYDSPDWSWFTDEVRVSLWGNIALDDIVVIPRARNLTLVADGASWTVSVDQEIHMRRVGSQVEMQFGRERLKATQATLVGHPEGAFDLRIPSQKGLRTYTGSLDVVVDPNDTDLHLINRVPLEDYVASVVGAEYGLDDEEGAKAMAVVARTYALFSLQQDRYLHDSERSQVYEGLHSANAAARQAAMSTAGEVLTWNGNLVEAVYSASNGGRTASNTSAWGSRPLPYFASRKDPWDARVSPHASWTWEVDADKLMGALSRAFDMDVRGFEIRQRADDGRVTRIRLEGLKDFKEISGEAFRSAVSRSFGTMTLKSVYFDTSSRRNSFRFDGRGFGHGVGLSQWGAHGMAREGRSYREILDFYYAGTLLDRIPTQSVPTRLSVESDGPDTAPDPNGSDIGPSSGSDDMAAETSGPDVSQAGEKKQPSARTDNEEAPKETKARPKRRRIGW
ncbi:MAG: SpoIID/LytB domain-containing protein [Bacteroidetes bacterium]|nr:SpoIID/LytB domain-containing protein [Bacteroidota bacterium]